MRVVNGDRSQSRLIKGCCNAVKLQASFEGFGQGKSSRTVFEFSAKTLLYSVTLHIRHRSKPDCSVAVENAGIPELERRHLVSGTGPNNGSIACNGMFWDHIPQVNEGLGDAPVKVIQG